jgi:hypothetical protein
MASLVLSGDTSGTVTLAAPAIAGTQSYTLPTATPAANGYALTSTTGGVMSWGTLATAAGGTGLASFTSGGVVYASSSSALTTGSALTFDGTNFATTGAISLNNNAGSAYFLRNGVGNTTFGYLYSDGTNLNLWNEQNGYLAFGVNNTAGMRLTSTGLGIGTTSPGAKLDVVGDANFLKSVGYNSSSDVFIALGGTDNGYVNNGAASTWRLFTSGNANGQSLKFDAFLRGTGWTTRATIDSSGNLGIGASSPTEKLEVSGNSAITGTGLYLALQRPLIPPGQNGNTVLAFRWYSTGTTYTTGAQIQATSEAAWTSTSAPARLELLTTASGSTTPTIRATLDSSGNLGLGVAPSVGYGKEFSISSDVASGVGGLGVRNLAVNNNNIYLSNNAKNTGAFTDSYWTSTVATKYQQDNGGHKWYTAPSGTAGNAITFTQALTLHTSTGMSLGSTSDPGATNLSVAGTITSGKGANVASASTTTLGAGNFFDITGTTTISNITIKPAGTVVYLKFDGNINLQTGTIGNSGALRLTGGATLAATQYDVLTLISDGTNWWQVAFNAN